MNSHAANIPSISLSHARAFLRSIDPDPDRLWCFRVLHPGYKVKGDPFPPSKCTGKLDDRMLARLQRFNEQGYGVFVVSNKGGHTKDKITDINVIDLDFDKTDDDHRARIIAAELPVSKLVESSPGKHHAYWFLGFNATPAEHREWIGVLIEYYGSDDLHDITRVTRLPGFLHTKNPDALFMSHVVETLDSDYEYTREEFVAWIDSLRALNVATRGTMPIVGGVVRAPGTHVACQLPKNITNDGLINAIKRGDELHPNILKLLGRFAKDGTPQADVEAVFNDLAPHIERSRPGRWAELAGGELERMYVHCLEQESRKEALRLEHRAQQRAEDEAFDATLNGDRLAETLELDDMLGRFVHLAQGDQVFDMRKPRCVLNYTDFVARTCSNMTWIEDPVSGKGKYVKNATLWKSSPNRVSADGVTFKAGGERFIDDKDGGEFVNTWRGWRVEGVAGDAGPFLDHVHMLFKDRADDFLDWLAHIIQSPGHLAHTCWLHVSGHHGTGRNWMASVLLRVMHGNVATNVDLTALMESGYNGRISQMCLAVVDEIRVGGTERWKHFEKFKQMITADTVMINPKYGHQHMEYNACRWLLFSNHVSAIPLEKEDRRTECVVNDDPPRDEAYFTRLYGLLHDEGFIAAIMHVLKTRDISAFNPGARAKDTVMKKRVFAASQRDDQNDLSDALDSWEFPLATVDELASMAGVSLDTRSTVSFSYALEDCGWTKLGRIKLAGLRKTIYCRKADYDFWYTKNPSEVKAALKNGGLPVVVVPMKAAK